MVLTFPSTGDVQQPKESQGSFLYVRCSGPCEQLLACGVQSCCDCRIEASKRQGNLDTRANKQMKTADGSLELLRPYFTEVFVGSVLASLQAIAAEEDRAARRCAAAEAVRGARSCSISR